jgi:hypothetical protein
MEEEDQERGVYTRPESSRSSLYWPVEVKVREGAVVERINPQARSTKKLLHNLDGDLKRVVHTARRLGAANRNTVYFSSWQHTETDRDKCSYHLMHAGAQLSFAERATALRYRTGTLFTAKQRYMFKLAPNSDCLLCGQPDGGHHTASGCSHLLKLYTYRHNKAGQLIMQAVRDGTMGAHVVMMDLGRAGEQSQQGQDREVQQQPPRRIPRDALPRAMPESVKAATTRHSIPDAFLFQPATQEYPAKYVIVEIKYCRDTDPRQQLDAAQNQHRPLEMAIRAAAPGALVQYVSIMLGVGGTIFKSCTTEPLAELGIRKGALKTLKHKLHRHAVKQLHWIYKVKRRHETHILADTQQVPCMGTAERQGTCTNNRQYRKRKSLGAKQTNSKQAWKRRKK